MKKLLIFIFAFIVIGVYGQEPWITGSNSGDGELRERFRYITNIFDAEDSAINALKYIDWDLEDNVEHQEGRTHWNDDDKTLETGLDQGSILQHGQEVHVRATNKTGDTIHNGQPVYVYGAQGNRPIIYLANSKDPVTSFNTVGLATQDILHNATGYVTLIGLVRDIPTDKGVVGQIAWVDSTDGEWTTTRPGAPLNAVVVGLILRSHATEGIIGVRITTVPRLAWLSDVDARDNQVTNEMLVWDDSMWIVRDSIATAALYLTDTYWDDLKAPFSTARRGALSKPDFDYDNIGLLFPQNDTVEIAYMIMQFSHKRKNGSDIEPHVHWQQMSSNDVVWKIVYKWFDNGEAVPSNWIPLIEDHDVFTYTSGNMLQITDFPTIDGSSITEVSSIFLVKIYRDDNVDGGAGGGDVLGFEFDIHFVSDMIGSTHEYVK